MRPRRAREKALFEQGDMLALYRYINRPDVMRTAIESDFGAALRDPSPEHFGQLYAAGWEARNLHMVANLRAAFRERPGARVLSIAGATHKPGSTACWARCRAWTWRRCCGRRDRIVAEPFP